MGTVLFPRRRTADWIARAVTTEVSAGAAAGMLALILASCWLISIILGGAGHVPPHWFYVPVLLAAVRFGPVGALVTAVAAGILAGPLLPSDVSSGAAQQHSDWTARMGFFLAIGLFMAAVIIRLRGALSRELDLARRERALARHKEEVVKTLAHELRTPLTVMIGTIETLDKRGFVAEDGRPMIESLQRSTKRLNQLIKVVVTAADALIRKSEQRQERVELRALCNAIASTRGGAERLRVETEPDAEVVTADPGLLQILLLQLIDNALKFSPADTPVEVRARRVSSGVELRICDRGPGISETYLDDAFDAFTQEDASDTRAHEGLGMGLFVARRIVDLMGGRIELSAREGGGTEVIVGLPQSPRD